MESQGRPDSQTSIEGVVDRITFANAENTFSVIKIAVPGRYDAVTVVGALAGVQPGESVHIEGRWTTDRKYGEQFRAESFRTMTPATLLGIEKYLASGLVRGVGQVMAERLVAHFGLQTLEFIDTTPERLTEVEGIGKVRKNRITAAWKEQREIREVMVFLQSHGVSTAFAVRIYKAYENQSISIVKENPYQLAVDIFGIGFKTADKIAAQLGVPHDSPRRIEAGVVHVLSEMSDEGHVYSLRSRLVGDVALALEVDPLAVVTSIDNLGRQGRISIEGDVGGDDAIFLPSLLAAEKGLAQCLVDLMATPKAPVEIDIAKALTWFESQSGLKLAPHQAEAIAQAIENKVTVITGGPGTGKTTLINGLIQILEKKKRRIVLAAPTGRAAKRLNETTAREAKTLHRVLKFNPKHGGFEFNRSNRLEVDVMIVDEVSMVDTVLAFDLLKTLPPSCQLILVGDIDQLPSVGPGSVLADLIQSGVLPVVKLSHIFRQAEQSAIVTAAHAVNRGELPVLRNDDRHSDFYFVEREEPEEIWATIKRLLEERLSAQRHLDPIDDVQVLTPMHRGFLGAANLNVEIQKLLNPTGEALTRGSRTFRVGDKVMQLRNNYDLDVYNGDIGRIDSIDLIEQVVSIRFDERTVLYDMGQLDELTLAYACSVHKAQGSEYPCVLIPLHTQHYVMLQRNLLYTALTRARKLVMIIGSKKALSIAVQNAKTSHRLTRLRERLKGTCV